MVTINNLRQFQGLGKIGDIINMKSPNSIFMMRSLAVKFTSVRFVCAFSRLPKCSIAHLSWFLQTASSHFYRALHFISIDHLGRLQQGYFGCFSNQVILRLNLTYFVWENKLNRGANQLVFMGKITCFGKSARRGEKRSSTETGYQQY